MPELTVNKNDTHATPPSGYSKLYPKVDGAWYSKDDDGTEVAIAGAGVSDHGALTGLADDDHTQYQRVDILTTKYKISDHFIGADLNWDIWTNSKSSGGDNGLEAIEYRGGAIRISSHGDADEWCELTTSIKSFYAADNPIMRSGQKLEQTSDVSVYIGFRDDYDNKIEFKANTSTGYWDCRCSSGGSTTTESGVLALDTDWHHFRIEAGSAQVLFYIDDVLEATIATNIPSTIMDVISQSYTTGGTAIRSHLCDYIEVVGDLDY